MTAPHHALLAALSEGDAEGVAAGLQQLVEHEDGMLLANALKPYEDQVPAVVVAGPPEVWADALGRLPTALTKRALFGSYARIPDARLRDLLAAMKPPAAARLVDAMSVGIDAPREMARVLSAADRRHSQLLTLVHPAALLRLLEQLPFAAGRAICGLAGADVLARTDAFLLERKDVLRRAWLAELAAAEAADAPRVAIDLLAAGPLAAATAELAAVGYRQLRGVLEELRPERVAELLLHLTGQQPAPAAALLEAADRRLLLRPPTPGQPVSEWLSESRAAAVVAALDPDAPESAALLQALPADHLEMLLPHLPWDRRQLVESQLASVSVPLGIEVLGVGSGRRRTRQIDAGRWVQIEEELDTGAARNRIVTDLLELPLDRVRLEARRAVSDEQALPVAQIAEVFEAYRAEGRRPSTEDFERFGLVQLSREVERTGALAAINGNFYFDYGHYLNGVTLGIEMDQVPGLFFGDPIAWFVSNEQELAPPSFNRAAAAVTANGDVLIDRVVMDEVRLGDQLVRWDDINLPKAPGRTVLYTSLFGTRTEASRTHVDVACARGQVWELSAGGAQVVPLTGFVLSVPRDLAGQVLAGVVPGTAVSSGSPFSRRNPDVVQAMACGPLLVRNGVIDLDFEREDFGQQDSTVMSFFLPRTVETYRAARSFLGLRGRTLVLGTVSGSAYGFGPSAGSAGVTFGELAQLCVDLALDSAYALDGGGSSSVVARDGGRARVLNAPTGGADVAAGEERYINTYWLIHSRQEHS